MITEEPQEPEDNDRDVTKSIICSGGVEPVNHERLYSVMWSEGEPQTFREVSENVHRERAQKEQMSIALYFSFTKDTSARSIKPTGLQMIPGEDFIPNQQPGKTDNIQR